MASVSHLNLIPRPNFFSLPVPPYSSGCPVTFDPDNTYFNQVPRIWMTLQNAVAAYWRVKSWKLEVVAGWEIAGQGSTFLSFEMQKTGLSPFKYIREAWNTPVGGGDFFLEYSSYFGDDPQNESHLVCDPPDLQLLDPEQNAFAGGSEFRYFGIGIPTTSDFMQTNVTITSNIIYNSENKLFAPFIRYSGTTFRWVTIYPHPFTASTSVGFAYGEHGTFNFKMLGQTFSCPIFAQNSRGGNVMDINVTLEAEEYWPYGGIYNETTGEPT